MAPGSALRGAFILLLCVAPIAREPRLGAPSRPVLTPVSVKDRSGQPIDGLEAAGIAVLDEGRPRKFSLDLFGTGVAPIALVIAVQSSDISAAVLEDVWKVGPMIQPLIKGEFGCAAVVVFPERVVWLLSLDTFRTFATRSAL